MIKSYTCIVSVFKGDVNSTSYTCASAWAGARGAPSATVAGAISVHRRPVGRHVDAAVACGSAHRGNTVRTQEHVYCVRAGLREDAPHAVTRAGRARGPPQAGCMPHASRGSQSVVKEGVNAIGVSFRAGNVIGGWGDARTPRYNAGVEKRCAFNCGAGRASSRGGCSPPKTFSKSTCDLVMQPFLVRSEPDGESGSQRNPPTSKEEESVPEKSQDTRAAAARAGGLLTPPRDAILVPPPRRRAHRACGAFWRRRPTWTCRVSARLTPYVPPAACLRAPRATRPRHAAVRSGLAAPADIVARRRPRAPAMPLRAADG